LRRSVSGKLFKVAKTKEHWADVKRSKNYIGDDFIRPFELRSTNIIEIFQDEHLKADVNSEEYKIW
jgi:hypothetical protein